MNKKNISLFIVCLIAASLISLSASTIFADSKERNQNNQSSSEINVENNTSGNKNGEQSQVKNGDKIDGQSHKNVISEFVQNLLNVADSEKSIGQEVKAVATEQDQSKEKVAEVIDTVNNRNAIKTFLIGSDYKNLGELRSETVKTENQISKLENLLEKTTSAGNQTVIQSQIQNLKQEQQKIESFVQTNENKFSLFGWFVKLFSK